MVSMRVSALFLCAVTASFMLHLDGKPLEENLQENALDKIIKADSSYADLQDSRHEVDMVLPKIKTSRERRSSGGDSMPASAIRETVKLWPNGIIPYIVAYTLKQNTIHGLIKEAIKEYEQKTCLRFVERTTQANYIEFYSGPGCQSDVGYQGTGVQQLSLGRGCESLDIVIHEIGHAIGFYHEQNRPDRDSYVNVLWDNIQTFMSHAYQMQTGWHPDSIRTPYDYYSIMHYGNRDFAKSRGVVTMTSKKAGITSFGGNRLSGLDAQRVRRMYRCPEFPDFPRDFVWSHNGRKAGKTCIKMDEPRDIQTWNNNYLCYNGQGKRPLNIRWSNRGTINGMSCTQITEPRKPTSTSWDDNYLCVPLNSPYKFKWHLKRPRYSERKNCMRNINEPRDRVWNRAYHYLCATERETDPHDGQWADWKPWGPCSLDCGSGYHMRSKTCSNPYPSNGGKSCVGKDFEQGTCNTQPCDGLPKFPEDFSYSESTGTIPRGHCLRTYDLRNYFAWNKYLFCTSPSKTAPGIAWSYLGPRPGMRCTKIYNPIETKLRWGSWTKNYLCVPMDSPYHFVWSLKGPIKGLACLRWYAQKGQKGWDKTYLCNKMQAKSIYAFRNR